MISRAETIENMHENYAQFQSALAMLDRTYGDLDLGVVYRETERANPNLDESGKSVEELLGQST